MSEPSLAGSKTPTRANPSTSPPASQATLAPVEVDSEVLRYALERMTNKEDHFQDVLDDHASNVPLMDFLLFLLSCCTGEEDRAVLEKKLDQLLDVSLHICSGQTGSEPYEPTNERRSRNKANGVDDGEAHSERAGKATTALIDSWRQHLQEYAKASSEEDGYAPFALLTNNVLQALRGETCRTKLTDIGLARRIGDQSHPRIIFQRNHSRLISTASHEDTIKDLEQCICEPDVVVLSLNDAHSLSGRAGVVPEERKSGAKTQDNEVPKEYQRASSLSQVKMCFKLMRNSSVDLSSRPIPSTVEKKDKPTDIEPQRWDAEGLTFTPGCTTEAHEPTATTAHTLSSTQKSKRPLAEDEDPRPTKRKKTTHVKLNGLAGPLWSAIYAAGKLAASLTADHALTAVVQDNVLYLWWYDHSGAIQSHGLDFFNDFSYFVTLLAILDYFNEEDWGARPGFEQVGHSGEKGTAYNLTLRGEGLATQDAVFRLNVQPSTPSLSHRLFRRGTTVLPVTSSSPNPLDEGTSLENVDMVVKIFHPETARMDESGLLKVAHSIAGSKLDPDGYVKDHLPLLLASRSWEDRYVGRMNALLKLKNSRKLKRMPRCFRVMVFVKLYPIQELRGKDFVKALWDCMCCHYGLSRNGVLHHDISENNLMYFRKLNGHVVGVLNDFDLAIVQGFSSNTNEIVGTVPFMAFELLTDMALDITRPHLYEYDFKSFYYVAVWIMCSYDGPHVVNNSPFVDWVAPTRYCTIAYAKRKIVETLACIQVTQAHTQSLYLLLPFSDAVCSCFDEQARRMSARRKANNMLVRSQWAKPKSIQKPEEQDLLNAQKTLADMDASVIWPNNLVGMNTTFTAIKSHFEEHLYNAKEETSRSNSPPRSLPNSPLGTATSPAKLPLEEISHVTTATTDDNEHTPAVTAGALHGMPAGRDPTPCTSTSDTFNLPITCLSVEGVVADASPGGDLSQEGGARTHRQPRREQDLEKCTVSQIMGNDMVVDRAGKTSRIFWQTVLGIQLHNGTLWQCSLKALILRSFPLVRSS